MKSTSDVMLRISNLQDAKQYYHGVLGFPIVTDTERVVGFDTGSIILYFERGEANGSVFEFEVDDLDETKRNLLGNGCVLVEENPSLPRCYLQDRFGLLFNITQTYGGR
jgi:catechol 2,3-dioxygenase-like lactoylglutathione lyase family enzyme